MVVYPFPAGAALLYSLIAQSLFVVSVGAQVEVPNRSINPKCERVKTCLVSIAHDVFGGCNVAFHEGKLPIVFELGISDACEPCQIGRRIHQPKRLRHSTTQTHISP
jgi:hypothetical protein